METFYGKLKSTSEDFVIVEAKRGYLVMPRFRADSDSECLIVGTTIPAAALTVALQSPSKTAIFAGVLSLNEDPIKFSGKWTAE